jgi:hypothetical protein
MGRVLLSLTLWMMRADEKEVCGVNEEKRKEKGTKRRAVEGGEPRRWWGRG